MSMKFKNNDQHLIISLSDDSARFNFIFSLHYFKQTQAKQHITTTCSFGKSWNFRINKAIVFQHLSEF